MTQMTLLSNEDVNFVLALLKIRVKNGSFTVVCIQCNLGNHLVLILLNDFKKALDSLTESNVVCAEELMILEDRATIEGMACLVANSAWCRDVKL